MSQGRLPSRAEHFIHASFWSVCLAEGFTAWRSFFHLQLLKFPARSAYPGCALHYLWSPCSILLSLVFYLEAGFSSVSCLVWRAWFLLRFWCFSEELLLSPLACCLDEDLSYCGGFQLLQSCIGITGNDQLSYLPDCCCSDTCFWF